MPEEKKLYLYVQIKDIEQNITIIHMNSEYIDLLIHSATLE